MKALIVWLAADPTNVVTLLTAAGFVLSVLKNLSQRLKLNRVSAALAGAQEIADTSTTAAVALVQGVEDLKKNMGPERAKAASRVMEAASLGAGVEHFVAPIVTAVQAAPDLPPAVIARVATGRLDPTVARARIDEPPAVAPPAGAS